jgi:N6-adenosine-specific RNA methylase IME4
MNELAKVDTWYKDLLVDLKKLEYTGIVLTKWNIGKRIVQDFDKFGKPEYGSKRIENIAKDLQKDSSDLYRCIKFYNQFRTGVQSLIGCSWEYVRKVILPEPRELIAEPQMALPPGKYSIIYADPPWQYYEGGYKNQSQHYPTMTIDKLAELPVNDLSADDCILFLWVTYPILPEALNLIGQWGFNYSTVGFTWVKANKGGKGFFFGLGAWTRSNAELCLIATRGSIARKDASISQIIYEPVGEHSAKPATVRNKIVQLVGDLPRIELFARQKIPGWDVWGNEV